MYLLRPQIFHSPLLVLRLLNIMLLWFVYDEGDVTSYNILFYGSRFFQMNYYKGTDIQMQFIWKVSQND